MFSKGKKWSTVTASSEHKLNTTPAHNYIKDILLLTNIIKCIQLEINRLENNLVYFGNQSFVKGAPYCITKKYFDLTYTFDKPNIFGNFMVIQEFWISTLQNIFFFFKRCYRYITLCYRTIPVRFPEGEIFRKQNFLHILKYTQN